MSDLTKLKEVLDNQKKRKIVKSAEWNPLDYGIVKNTEDKDITLKIYSEQIGFVFTLKGRLIGMYNWKD